MIQTSAARLPDRIFWRELGDQAGGAVGVGFD